MRGASMMEFNPLWQSKHQFIEQSNSIPVEFSNANLPLPIALK